MWVSRHALPVSAPLSLEIPRAPITNPGATEKMRIVTTHAKQAGMWHSRATRSRPIEGRGPEAVVTRATFIAVFGTVAPQSYLRNAENLANCEVQVYFVHNNSELEGNPAATGSPPMGTTVRLILPTTLDVDIRGQLSPLWNPYRRYNEGIHGNMAGIFAIRPRWTLLRLHECTTVMQSYSMPMVCLRSCGAILESNHEIESSHIAALEFYTPAQSPETRPCKDHDGDTEALSPKGLTPTLIWIFVRCRDVYRSTTT